MIPFLKNDLDIIISTIIIKYMKEFSSELKRKRKRLGMSQAQLAQALNTHVQTLSRWERGTLKPRLAFAVLAFLDSLEQPKEQRFGQAGRPKGKT